MSQLSGPTEIKGLLHFRDVENSIPERNIPDWALWLLWSGSTLFCLDTEASRSILVVLLPTRTCCAALVTLGALLGSASLPCHKLSWKEIANLPYGSSVNLRIANPNKPGNHIRAEGCIESTGIDGSRYIRFYKEIKIDRGIVRGKTIIPENADNYLITQYSQASQRMTSRRTKHIGFYRGVVGKLDSLWLASNTVECMIVTKRSSWQKENRSLEVACAGRRAERIWHPLPELLMAKSDVSGAKVIIRSPGTMESPGNEAKLAILDGPDALLSMDYIQADKFIVLLDRGEYQEGVRGILAGLADRRDESITETSLKSFIEPPAGIEAAFYGMTEG